MNKKGQYQPFFLLMVGIIIFLIAFSLAGAFVKTMAQTQDNLNCSNSNLTTFQKINCTTTDMIAPFVLAIIIGLGGTALTAKLMGG